MDEFYPLIFDFMEKETPKAILLLKDDKLAWIPKSCTKNLDALNCTVDIISTFTVIWRDETYIPKQSIVVTPENIADLWEYI